MRGRLVHAHRMWHVAFVVTCLWRSAENIVLVVALLAVGAGDYHKVLPEALATAAMTLRKHHCFPGYEQCEGGTVVPCRTTGHEQVSHARVGRVQ